MKQTREANPKATLDMASNPAPRDRAWLEIKRSILRKLNARLTVPRPIHENSARL